MSEEESQILGNGDASAPAEAAAPPWLGERGIAALLIAAITIRWIVSAVRQLVPDEAYYWVWSRHLALSYFDHPPMIAYVIRLGTLVLGQTELGVRWLAAILAYGAALIAIVTMRKLTHDWKPTAFVAVMLCVSPMLSVMGTIITPDTPAVFFEMAALACAVWIFRMEEAGGVAEGAPVKPYRQRRIALPWILFGVLFGLALLSKYPSVLLGIAVLVTLLLTSTGRRQLCTIWPWLAAVISLAVFSPVIIWNAGHHWASFSFQLHHGLSDVKPRMFSRGLSYVLGQAAVCTPVLFIMIIAVIVLRLRRWRQTAAHVRLLTITTLVILLFFAATSLRHRVEGNWPIFAYFPGTLLVADYLHEKWTGRRVKWARVAVTVAVIATVVIQVPEMFWAISPKLKFKQWNQMFGWRQLAEEVNSVAGYRPIMGIDYHYASELSFYLPGKPMVTVLNQGWAARPTEYDYLPGKRLIEDYNSVVLVGPAPDHPTSTKVAGFTVIPYDQHHQRQLIRENWIMISHK